MSSVGLERSVRMHHRLPHNMGLLTIHYSASSRFSPAPWSPLVQARPIACRRRPAPAPLCQPPCPRRRSGRHAAASAPAASSAQTAPLLPKAAGEEGSTRHGIQLALSVLRPDLPLLLATAIVLVATIYTTLAFPLAIGDLFDVVRQQLGDAAAAATAVAPGGNGWVGTLAALQSAAASAPPNFRPVLFRLYACLAGSAMGNAAVAYLAPLLGERFGARLRQRVMLEILSKRQSFFDATAKGDLVGRLTLDVTVLQAVLADFVGQRGFRSMLEVVCSLGIIAAKNPLLALVSFVITPALSRVLRSVVVRAAELTLRRQQAAARALEFATERLTHVRTVQVFNQESREAEAYRELSEEGYQLAKRCAVFQGVVEGAGRLAVNIGSLSLLGLGGYLVLQGRITLGALLAANVYNLFLAVGLASVAASLGDLGKAIGALERVAEVAGDSGRDPAAVELGEDRLTSTSGSSGAADSNGSTVNGGAGSSVDFRDVWFKYDGRDDWALQGLSLRVAAGSTVALVGASGGGKSTVGALLLGLYTPQRGTIAIDGVPLTAETIPEARSLMGAALQQPMLLSGSVADQIRFGRPEATEAEVAAAAVGANADGFISELPAGYETEVGERGHALSGGQKQRLAIARALARRPRLLLLDEPTAALDVESERAVDNALRRLDSCTKVVIAHRLTTVRRADSIAVVQGGRVVEQGSHEELMTVHDGVYRRMVLTSELGGDFEEALVVGSETGNGAAREALPTP